jgi:quercetin 2,3-dioxygenase
VYKPITGIRALSFQWETRDPFLFCVHHDDLYPPGNAGLGPAASLAGRSIGQDFTPRDGWRMYHGDTVPGFPSHPHRGFETVTVVTKGLVDHADSHGAAGRYGGGDVQWMTAGAGLQHAEMFPLVNETTPNPLELFQIWLNLPGASKFVAPHFKMLWAEALPQVVVADEQGCETAVTLIAGQLGKVAAPPPAPDSWAADPRNEVAIWLIDMEPGAAWTLPPAEGPVNRTLYLFEGGPVTVAGAEVPAAHAAELLAVDELAVRNGAAPARLVLLQGRPIGEPVMQYGPFVMNTEAEIRQAFADYRRTQFGGWPWDRRDPVHGRRGRFARYADGREETP